LAFIVIPEGLSQMPLSILWSMLFFAMLFLLGIDSQFAMVETVITYIFDTMVNKFHYKKFDTIFQNRNIIMNDYYCNDTYSQLLQRKMNRNVNKPVIVTIAGILWFICGLPLCTNAGIYILNLMDTYAAGFPCLLIGLLEIFIVNYIYGYLNL
jgi:solute carrier family 6 amino acid transporter-like protein 5/7/9/14